MPRISDLTSYTAPSNSDLLAIVDQAGAVTKKITRADLLKGTALPADTVTTPAIADGAVTGAKIATYKVNRQDNASNSVESAAKLQSGWKVVAINTGQARYIIDVTFPVAYTDKPIVLAINGGDCLTAGGSAYGNGILSITGTWRSQAQAITTTGFQMVLEANGNPGANGYVWGQWIAIGN